MKRTIVPAPPAWTRPRTARLTLWCGAGLVGVLALVGCNPNPFDDTTAAPSAPSPDSDLSATDAAACSELIENLPDTVADQTRRSAGPSASTAQWGVPPVRLECGVAAPAGFKPTSTCQVVNGVDWYIDDKVLDDPSEDVVMTSVTTSPRVQVTVPGSLRPPAAAMVDLAPAVKKSLRRTGRCG